MTWGAAAVIGGSVVSGYFGNKAAKQQAAGMNAQAAAQVEAARIALLLGLVLLPLSLLMTA
jgi:hypothetical protein